MRIVETCAIETLPDGFNGCREGDVVPLEAEVETFDPVDLSLANESIVDNALRQHSREISFALFDVALKEDKLRAYGYDTDEIKRRTYNGYMTAKRALKQKDLVIRDISIPPPEKAYPDLGGRDD